MALQYTKKVTLCDAEISFANAYAKIFRIIGDRDSLVLNVSTRTSDKEYEIELSSYQFTPSLEDGADNFIKQGYEYLKTLEEFAEAEDC